MEGQVGQVAAAGGDDPVEEVGGGWHVDRWTERLAPVVVGEAADERERRLELGLAGVVVGVHGRRDVPAVDDHLVQRDQAGDLAGHLDPAGGGHARPGVGVGPGVGEGGQLIRDRVAPVG